MTHTHRIGALIVLALSVLPSAADDRRDFDARRKEREARLAAGGGDQASEDGVRAGLDWLARHQSPDGAWECDGFSENCKGTECEGAGYGEHRIGVTGLALLAFLGAGYTHLSKEANDEGTVYGEVVKKGFRFLIQAQEADGSIRGEGTKPMYNHAIATLALAEEYGMTSSAIFKEPAQMAVGWLVKSRNPGHGWRYAPRSGDNDTSVTSWCLMALKSARLSGIDVPDQAFDDAMAWIEEATDPKDGKVGYNARETAGIKVVVPGKNEDYRHHETMTAVGVLSRVLVRRDAGDVAVKQGVDVLSQDLPKWDPARLGNDYYYWYYGTLAVFQADGPGAAGEHAAWKGWEKAVRNALVLNQRPEEDGCLRGSWDPDDRWGFEGGRVCATALNTMTLEVYYRYANAFEGK